LSSVRAEPGGSKSGAPPRSLLFFCDAALEEEQPFDKLEASGESDGAL
jgi:hypothetical protein